jgi:hypothetical protein
MQPMKTISITASLAMLPILGVNAAIILSGSATMTLEEGLADSISELDADFINSATTRAETLSLPAPGNAPFLESDSSVVLCCEAPRGHSGDRRVTTTKKRLSTLKAIVVKFFGNADHLPGSLDGRDIGINEMA